MEGFIHIAQMPMSATIADNIEVMQDYLHRASRLGGGITVFPECATTGFHRGLREICNPQDISEGVASIEETCRSLETSALFGTPWYPTSDGRTVWNAAVLVGPDGPVSVAPKVGITASEASFFSAGPSTGGFRLGELRCGSVLCREILDRDRLQERFSDGLDLLFWPGYIAWMAEEAEDELLGNAREVAAELGCMILQCNWPHALNSASTTTMGGSMVIAADGSIASRAATDRAELMTVRAPHHAV